MKKALPFLLLFLTLLIQAQDKVSIKKGEITIPIGQKILLHPEFENNKITNFKLIKEENINAKIDLFDMMTNFQKDDSKDNTIELIFSEATMMTSSVYALLTIQKTGKKMTFKAKTRLKGTSSYQTTSIMPSVSNASHVEQWQDNIDSIILYDFELID